MQLHHNNNLNVNRRNIGDMERNLLSEVVWPYSERNEKFYFENPSVCLIFNCGELTLVEYGNDQILATVR